METIKLILVAFEVLFMICYFFTWGQAYHNAKVTDKWQKQLSVLQPWWFLDSQLLSKDNDYLRKRAIIYFILCFVPLIGFWLIGGF